MSSVEPDGPELTFSKSAIQYVLDVFDWTVQDVPDSTEQDPEQIVVDADGNPAPSYDGDPVPKEDVGAIVQDSDGNPAILRDNYASIVSYVSDKHEREQSEQVDGRSSEVETGESIDE